MQVCFLISHQSVFSCLIKQSFTTRTGPMLIALLSMIITSTVSVTQPVWCVFPYSDTEPRKFLLDGWFCFLATYTSVEIHFRICTIPGTINAFKFFCRETTVGVVVVGFTLIVHPTKPHQLTSKLASTQIRVRSFRKSDCCSGSVFKRSISGRPISCGIFCRICWYWHYLEAWTYVRSCGRCWSIGGSYSRPLWQYEGAHKRHGLRKLTR